MTSAFGIEHDFNVSKMTDKQKKQAAVGAGGVAAVGAASQVKIPEHSHYDKKTRAHIASLPPGVHEVDTKMLATRPRKLGARKNQKGYVATMAHERPAPYSPVPITRYKDGIIQRDNAHSVMANAMKGRKTLVKIEDAPGYRPHRKAGEELIRRGQMRYQQRRLKQSFNLPEKKQAKLRSTYTSKQRIANTTKRPHGVVEEGFKLPRHPYGVKTALGLVRKDRRSKDPAAGAFGVGGAATVAATPVRRSGTKINVSGGSMSAADARKVVSPGYRPGNKKAIQTMARNLGHLENKPTRVIRYGDGKVIPFDGNHRATARLARGDAKVPVEVIEGGNRPAISAARNALHVGQQRVHRARMDRGDFKATAATGKHTGERRAYKLIANGSKVRSAHGLNISGTRIASGPSDAVLRTKQGAMLATGGALLGTAAHLNRKGKR